MLKFLKKFRFRKEDSDLENGKYVFLSRPDDDETAWWIKMNARMFPCKDYLVSLIKIYFEAEDLLERVDAMVTLRDKLNIKDEKFKQFKNAVAEYYIRFIPNK